MGDASLYLGKWCDPESLKPTGDYALFEADRLTRHAVCFGMTGSGKTGLCVSLLEELAMGGVPLLIIDPKGDMTNLALAFREMGDDDFAKWIDPAEAERSGMTVEAYGAKIASRWRDGLADWGVDADRIRAYTDRTEVTVFTPGSTAGVPVNLLSALHAPADTSDPELLATLVSGVVTGLLGLVGINADPIKDPRHIVLSRIIETAWCDGKDLDLETVILMLVDPPFKKVGVFPVDRFYPRDDRMDLAMTLNGVMAAPSFQVWSQGVTLDPGELLSADKTPVRIFSLAHLDDNQRTFFISMLLNRLVGWSRQQPGTGTLRAMLYFDEVFGYLPPYPKNPPAKGPILTLMKQARAVGLGTMLVTQNPVDVDYKALSNAGLWFIGRLQTEQDRDRVLDGLSSAAGSIDRKTLTDWLTRMPSRTFLVRDVKEREPRLVHSRWAISYLRGPMTRREIQALEQKSPAAPVPSASSAPAPAPAPEAPSPAEAPKASTAGLLQVPPPAPASFAYRFLDPAVVFSARLAPFFEGSAEARRSDGTVVWRPAVHAQVSLRFDEGRDWAVDRVEHRLFFPASDGDVSYAGEAPISENDLLERDPEGLFAPLPPDLDERKELQALKRRIVDEIYRGETERMFHHKGTRLRSHAGETRAAFEDRVKEALQDVVDEKVQKLQKRTQGKVDRLEAKRDKLMLDLERHQSDASARFTNEVASAGEALFGMFFGRRSSTRVSSAMRRRAQTQKANQRVGQTEERIRDLDHEIYELESEVSTEILAIENEVFATRDEIEEMDVGLEKDDIKVDAFGILWIPVSRAV